MDDTEDEISSTNNPSDDVEASRFRLRQKRARLLLAETRLKIRERKSRTRDLIELSGLVTKAGLDNLTTSTLYGALLYLKEQLGNSKQVTSDWQIKGDTAFKLEKKEKIPVILQLEAKPPQQIRDHINASFG